MKIYEIGTGYTPIPAQVAAATESVVEDLSKAFIKKGVPVQVIDISAQNRIATDLPIIEVKVPSVFTKSDVSLGLVHKLKRVAYSVALAFKLKEILKNESEKVVLHFHNQYNLFFYLKFVSKKLQKKAVIAYTNHNGLWSLPWQEVESRLRKRYFQEIEGIKNADVVFVLNKNSKKNIDENFKTKTVLINNGVNTEVYHPLDSRAVDEIKGKYGLLGKKVILQVGSVYENKGQDRAIDLMLPILQQDKNTVYVFAGGIVSQEYFEKVKEKIENSGIKEQAVYLGSFVPGEEMNNLYNMADATVFLSSYEGFPLVCIEALSAGVPVIMKKSSTFDMPDRCLAFENGDDFKKAVASVTYDEDKNKFSQSARQCAEAEYSWEKTADKYLSAFESFGKENCNA